MKFIPNFLQAHYLQIVVKEVQLKSMKWKISKISSLTHCHFSHEKIHRNENNFLRTFIIGNVQIIPVYFFKVIIRVFSNTKSPKHHIFSCVLKPDKLKGRFNGELLGILHTFEWTSFESWCIYEYRVIMQNVNQRYLGTEYNHKLLFFF